jgi:hypothetical protein
MSKEIGARARHGCHTLGHASPCGISTNTWRVAVWVKWSTNLGRIWAELGLGPKTKVEAHEQLYTFRLKHKVISVLD